ncbi:exodeoxyribonuclease V subunit beta, partial [Pseudomonas aeruginosa]|nr:exodeoxyribonuclease V subunit beta [Pseudomonas aeruginosa]
AIYAFRGADIFTYMKARGDVAAHYTLDTNWRSSPGISQTFIAGTSAASTVKRSPLFFAAAFTGRNGISWNMKGLSLRLNSRLTLPTMPGDTVGSGDYQTFMAQLCATQIRDWLSADQQGRALLWRGETSRPVQASDITVLVRNRLEAAQVREALQTLGIPSVYLSNRDSVFETLEAQELLWLLQAVLAPE